jgi:AcrR family transcriptional regulator
MKASAESRKLSRKEREHQLRRDEILRAATKLFATKGYHSTTMNEIAKEAEFSTGSLYNFFKNKEELYFSLLYEKIEELAGLVDITRTMPGSACAKFDRAVDITLDYFERERDFFRIFTVHRDSFFEASLRSDFTERLRTQIFKYIEDLVSVAEEGIDAGEFRSFSGHEIAMSFTAIIHSFLVMWIESEEKYLVRDKKDVILDIFYHGISNPDKGSKG